VLRNWWIWDVVNITFFTHAWFLHDVLLIMQRQTVTDSEQKERVLYKVTQAVTTTFFQNKEHRFKSLTLRVDMTPVVTCSTACTVSKQSNMASLSSWWRRPASKIREEISRKEKSFQWSVSTQRHTFIPAGPCCSSWAGPSVSSWSQHTETQKVKSLTRKLWYCRKSHEGNYLTEESF